MLLQTIGSLLRDTATEFPDSYGITADDFLLTWAEIDRKVDNRCYYFTNQGIEPKSRVGIWSINSGEYVLSVLALTRIGAVPVLLNTGLSDQELMTLCERTDLTHLLYGDGYKKCLIFANVNNHTSPENELILLSMADFEANSIEYQSKPKFHDYEEYNDVALILFTSGSTELPKGVQLSHLSLVNNAKAIAAGMAWNLDDRLCVTVPFFHCFGMTACILTALHTGLNLIILSRFRSVPCFEKIEKYQCTILSGVPSMYLIMYNNPKREKYNLQSIKSGIIAGSPISIEDYRKVRSMFHKDCAIQPSYGQTETAPCCTLLERNGKITDTLHAGKVIQDVELRIVDDEGKIIKSNQIGNIEVKGYNLMRGYYNQDKATAEAFTADGWFKTGDLGYFDDEANLLITGRKKYVIIRGGENISPVEIEFALKRIAGVLEAHVFGIPDPILQDEICACIIIDSNFKYTEEEMKILLADYLSAYKIPKFILFFNDFPKTASEKIALGELHRQAYKILEGKKKTRR